jgi:hypothetical protein
MVSDEETTMGFAFVIAVIVTLAPVPSSMARIDPCALIAFVLNMLLPSFE